MSYQNQNYNRNWNKKPKKKKDDVNIFAIVIILGVLVPGLSGLLIPLLVLYFVLKNFGGVDLVAELKKIINGGGDRRTTTDDRADYSQEYTENFTRNSAGAPRSSVRRTDDPCGNEDYHSTFGTEARPQNRSGVRKTDDPCGNEGYHSTFGTEERPQNHSGTRRADGDPCGNEGYHSTFGEQGHLPPQNARPQGKNRTRRTVRDTVADHAAQAKQAVQEKINALLKKSKRLSAIGAGWGGLFGLCAIIEEIESLIERRGILGEDFLVLLVFALAGAGVFAMGKFRTAKVKQFRKIIAVIGDNTTHISIHALADAMAMSEEKVEKLVQEMIDEELFSDAAYIDVTTGYLILDGKGVDKEEEKPAAESNELDLDILREIRRVNADIPDPVMTRKISRIEEITGHILDYQKKHPEKTPELRKFLDYYLPTTLKILNTYAELDKKGLTGDNASTTKGRIEKMMDNVVEGFEAQLDKLFEGEMMDISSDITVMEKMLDSDGLTGGFKVPKMDTESVADEAFQTIGLTMDPVEPTRPIAQPQPAVLQTEPPAYPTAGAYSGINLTLEPEEESAAPASESMFQSIHQSAGASSADDMFQSIHQSLGQEENEDWKSGFYHHTKDELE